MIKQYSYIFIFSIFAKITYCQSITTFNSNLRKKIISTKSAILTLDSLSIIPQSLYIKDISSTAYIINETDARLTWISKPNADSIEITYRVFPIKWNKEYQHLKYNDIQNNFLIENTTAISNYSSRNIFEDNPTILTDGSIGKGISFGNNQDAAVQSSLNLQIRGYVADSIEISASISDDTYPLQQGGYTNNLNEIDKIYIQLKKNGWKINLGDIDLKQNNFSFLHFNKRIQGFSYNTKFKSEKNKHNNTTISGAISKGKYTRNILSVMEGNQGPYKLQGNNNELYFSIISGSEKVFIDGNLQQRGEDGDYVMDYNNAEITFTPKNIVTKDKRIQIEFEYIDRNFLNTQLFIQDIFEPTREIKFKVGFISNADSKYSTIDQALNSKQKGFLTNLGDSIQQAYFDNASVDTFSVSKILYKKIDTSYQNKHDSIYVTSRDNQERLYNVSFSYMGSGKGNYIQIIDANNGKSFKWIQPNSDLTKNGDWEPVSFLVTPKKLQILSLGIDYTPNNKTSLQTEFAISNYDMNLFSNKEKRDNIGVAAKIAISNVSHNLYFLNKALRIENKASFQYVQYRFKPMERVRDIEFYRNWALQQNIKQESNELISDYNIQIKNEHGSFIDYQFQKFNQANWYKGNKNNFTLHVKYRYITFIQSVNYLTFEDKNKKGYFSRPQIEINSIWKKWKQTQIGTKYSIEKNHVQAIDSIALSKESFQFDKLDFFVKSNQAELNKWELNFFRRTDYIPNDKNLLKSDYSDNIVFSSEWYKNPVHQIRINSTFRELHITRKELTTQKADKNITGRIEYNFTPKYKLLNSIFLYEIGGGQEQKKEYTYLQVPTGQGLYFWNDYNKNGIEELNEFETAIYQDQKKYIRIYTPSNDFVKARYFQCHYNINFNPSEVILNQSSTFKMLLSRINTVSSFEMYKKNISDNSLFINPFERNKNDSSLINQNTFVSNNFYYNRYSSIWGIEMNQTLSNTKSILTYGLENQKSLSNIGRIRYNFNKNFTAGFIYKNIMNNHFITGDYFKNQNYKIEQQSFEPSISYMYQSNFRITFSYINNKKQNLTDSVEKSISNAFLTEIKYNLFSNTSIVSKLVFNQLDYVSAANIYNTSVGFLLLDGLSPGKNILWNIDLVKRLSGNMEMNIQYEGRSTSTRKLVNIGRASIRALF